MTINVLTKELAGLEDLLIGEGSADQTRNDIVYPMSKLAPTIQVTNKAAAVLLTPTLGVNVLITSSDGKGNLWRAVVGAPSNTYADDGGLYCGTVIIPTGGDGSSALVRDYYGAYRAVWYGKYLNSSPAANTLAIQTAIDLANTNGGGVVDLGDGVIQLAVGGSYAGRDYGIRLKSYATLRGSGSELTSLKQAVAQNMDVVVDDHTLLTTGISLYGVTIDGDVTNQTGGSGGGINLWIKNSTQLKLDDVKSKDSDNFGIRLETITNMAVGTIQVDHIADLNADGLHLFDVSYAVFDKIIINTAGDDGFIITAQLEDSHDISVGELVITTPVTTTAAGRGILLNLSDVANAAGNQFSIYNINIANAVTYNCKGAALHLAYAEFYNVNINLIDHGSKYVMAADVGSATVTGFIRNCEFNLKSWNPTVSSITSTITDGVIKHNKLSLQSYNPADTFVDVILRGDYWDASIQIDYDPLGTKAAPSYGLDVFGSFNEIHTNIDGADTNINLRSTATYNTIHPTRLQNAVTSEVEVRAGAVGNRFIGGSIAGVINNNESAEFYGVQGANSYGSISISPDANGNGTIPHTLVGTPNNIKVGVRGDNVNGVDVQSVDGTNITVRIKDAAGADVAAGSFTIDWEAKL